MLVLNWIWPRLAVSHSVVQTSLSILKLGLLLLLFLLLEALTLLLRRLLKLCTLLRKSIVLHGRRLLLLLLLHTLTDVRLLLVMLHIAKSGPQGVTLNCCWSWLERNCIRNLGVAMIANQRCTGIKSLHSSRHTNRRRHILPRCRRK